MGKTKDAPEPVKESEPENQEDLPAWEFKTPYKPFILPEFAEKKEDRKPKKKRRRYAKDSYADDTYDEYDDEGNKREPPYDPYKDPSDQTNLYLKPEAASNVEVVAITCRNANESGNSTRLGWAGRVEHSMNISEAAKAKQNALDNMTTFIHDPNRLLEVSITTIILAAVGQPLSYEHLIFTSLYLRNIRDEHGDHPPNISNFIHYLNFLRRSQYADRGQEETVEDTCSSQQRGRDEQDQVYVNDEMLQKYTTDPDRQTTVSKYIYRKKRPKKVPFCDELDPAAHQLTKAESKKCRIMEREMSKSCPWDGSDNHSDRASNNEPRDRRYSEQREDYRYNQKDPNYQSQNDCSYRANSTFYPEEPKVCRSRNQSQNETLYETAQNIEEPKKKEKKKSVKIDKEPPPPPTKDKKKKEEPPVEEKQKKENKKNEEGKQKKEEYPPLPSKGGEEKVRKKAGQDIKTLSARSRQSSSSRGRSSKRISSCSSIEQQSRQSSRYRSEESPSSSREQSRQGSPSSSRGQSRPGTGTPRRPQSSQREKRTHKAEI